jgi:hypothetical protein
MDEGDSMNGVSLSEDVQCGGPGGRAPLLGTLGYTRPLGQASLYMGTQLGNLEWACLLGTLRDG